MLAAGDVDQSIDPTFTFLDVLNLVVSLCHEDYRSVDLSDEALFDGSDQYGNRVSRFRSLALGKHHEKQD